VVDANGSGVGGVALTLAASGGLVVDSTLVTDSTGTATTRWTLGRSAGEYSLGVHADGVKKLLKLTARAKPAAAANLAFDDDPSDKRAREGLKRRRLLAVVTDVYGNPVPDARVSFAVKSGTVTPGRAVSDSKGRTALTWKIGSRPGEQVLVGSVRGTDVSGEYIVQVPGRDPVPKTASVRSQK
jgi:hypothetical protein